MLRGCLLGLALAAACGGDHGAFLAIESPVPLTNVELFIGGAPIDPKQCGYTTCVVTPEHAADTNGMSPMSYSASVFTEASPTAFRQPMAGTKLNIQIDPGVEGETIAALLIVGYGDSGDPVADKIIYDVPVKAGAVEIEVHLDMADGLTGDPSLERIKVWRRPSDSDQSQSACALVRHSDQRRANDYFGPSPDDDTDCDGATPKPAPAYECGGDGLSWCGAQPPGLSEATCITPGETGSCRLAGPQCVDGQGSANPLCPQANPCVPTGPIGCTVDATCHAAITTFGCNSLDATCLDQVIGSNNVPHAGCPLITSGGFCMSHIDAADPSFATVLGNRTCKTLQLAAIASPFRPTTGQLTVANGMFTLTATGCVGDVTFTSAQPTVTPPTIFLVFTVDDNGTTEYLALPMTATTGTCATSAQNCFADGSSPITCP